jgi:hypothetical protein
LWVWLFLKFNGPHFYCWLYRSNGQNRLFSHQFCTCLLKQKHNTTTDYRNKYGRCQEFSKLAQLENLIKKSHLIALRTFSWLS